MRRDDPKKCIECNIDLPFRYKGRQKIYCSDFCRKSFNKRKENKS